MSLPDRQEGEPSYITRYREKLNDPGFREETERDALRYVRSTEWLAKKARAAQNGHEQLTFGRVL